jgi:quinoprotein dehydrogenase-associated probable ABC transporter substrate-binding protein
MNQLLRCALLLLALSACSSDREGKQLRVCSDPNNLPFSNQREEGFENRIADLIALELGAHVRYTWQPQHRGFIRNTLSSGVCDLVMAMPSGAGQVLTTRPYYRSTYVFVYRRDRGLRVRSLDDPILRKVRIGVQLVGADYTNTPPVHALSRRGIVKNLVGFSVLGDYSQPNPPARIMDAVIAREVDLGIVWGPLAGYFAKRAPVRLEIVPVSPSVDPPGLHFAFDIALAVRRGEEKFRQQLQAILDRRKSSVDSILTAYGVPLLPIPEEPGFRN